ncbi:hypothetical protein WICPIJ_007462 [Wickerhamomyces pijperi]|uniref:DNA replication complex GINS protein PSF2 n=1 Tax=Wickerhamomyces pijperi TaxID=599730 RepID=A0A9P8TJ93_WICPI|nr:hypothetical protein WICPIJ_007462 [Wickerhamomyces pijperi]
MALPRHLQNTFTPQELEFLTESELVRISPRYKFNGLDLITAKIPDMMPNRTMEVPLWYAILLKKQNRCRMFTPDWLTEDNLKAYLKKEKGNANAFTNLPFNWLELSKIYFTYASDEFRIDEIPKLKQLIAELKEVRAIKVQTGLKSIDEHYLQLDNLSRMEINEIRRFVTDVMGKYIQLKNTLVPEDEYEEDDEDVPMPTVGAAGEDDDEDGYENEGYEYNYNQ